jgi:hypothetical protein
MPSEEGRARTLSGVVADTWWHAAWPDALKIKSTMVRTRRHERRLVQVLKAGLVQGKPRWATRSCMAARLPTEEDEAVPVPHQTTRRWSR